MSRLESYAIISARMSNIGCKDGISSRLVRSWEIELCAYLGDGAVVDLDQVPRGRVDLEALVEGKSGLDSLGSYSHY